MLQQYSQRLLIATVKAAAVRIGFFLRGGGRRGVFKQPPLNKHRGDGQSGKPAQHQGDQQHLEQRFAILPGRVLGKANRREGEDGDDRRAKQRQGRATDHIVNRAQQRRALLTGDEHPFDNHNGIVHQHTQGDDKRSEGDPL